VVVGSLDVRDAFLQVEQDDPVLVYLQEEPFVIRRNLPGQRLGAKQWFLCLKAFLQSSLGSPLRTALLGPNTWGHHHDPR
jgi:hypothetical protein